jgi:hypothetical protein
LDSAFWVNTGGSLLVDFGVTFLTKLDNTEIREEAIRALDQYLMDDLATFDKGIAALYKNMMGFVEAEISEPASILFSIIHSRKNRTPAAWQLIHKTEGGIIHL